MKSTKMNLGKMQLCNAVVFSANKLVREDGITTGGNDADPTLPPPPKK